MRLSRRLVTGRKAFTQPNFWDAGAHGPSIHLQPWNAHEDIDRAFTEGVQAAYKRNGIIYALSLARRSVFSEARFQYRQMRFGRPGKLFGTGDLSILEKPWHNGTTGDLLNRMLLDVDRAGNSYVVTRGDSLRLLRPEYVTIILGSNGKEAEHAWEIDAEPIGYVYEPRPGDITVLTPDECSPFAPEPDPDARYRGMSWITPVINELESDNAATEHKLKYFQQGATGRLVITVDKDMTPERYKEYVRRIDKRTNGAAGAYKNLYLGGGADVKAVGADLKNLDFRAVQGAGETRVAAAAGVPPVIAGFSEGLQAATYSNYAQARRRFADGTLRPLWRNVAGSLASIIKVPADAELWYDDRDIAFLREDAKDSAEIMSRKMLTVESGVRAGYKPETVVAAVEAQDLSLMEHTGLYSVQLQPPTTETPGTSAGGPNPAPPEE